jgi:O-antigen/teichoic acid export membrane protein
VFWSALFGHTVVALGLQRKMIVAYAADAALSLALYVWAVPRFGGLGAAWVTVFSETFIMVVTAWAVIAKTGLKPPGRVFVRCAAASACMAGVVALAAPYHVIVRIIVGAVVYAVLLSAFGVLTRERLSFLRRPNAASGPVLQ